MYGSAINSSVNPQQLMITEYKSADAFPMTEHKILSRYMDAVIRGANATSPRYREMLDFEIHHHYDGDSLFDLQDIVEKK